MLNRLICSLPFLSLVLATPYPKAGSGRFGATTTWHFAGNTIPTGLSVNEYSVASTPVAHHFDKRNVHVEDGYLNLVVPGGQQGEHSISSAEIQTDITTLYGSVRVWAILTETPGVCNGVLVKH